MNFHVQSTQVNVPHVVQEMAATALDLPNIYLENNREELISRKNYICKRQKAHT